MSIEVKIRKGEPMEKALRRFKKKLDRENIIRDYRAKRYFEKPCAVRRRKKKVMAFTNMLRERYLNQKSAPRLARAAAVSRKGLKGVVYFVFVF